MLAEIRTQLARLDDLVQDYLSLVRVAQIERTPEDSGRYYARGLRNGSPGERPGHHMPARWAGRPGRRSRARQYPTPRAAQSRAECAGGHAPGGALTLRGRRAGATVQLDVCDTGSGIPPEQRARIFEPLYTTKAGGTGLGLYIVQEVVAAHGGQVGVQSVEGQGSTFTLTLPLMESREVP